MRGVLAGRRRSVFALAFAAVLMVGLSGCLGTSGVGDVDDVLYPDQADGTIAQTTVNETGAGGSGAQPAAESTEAGGSTTTAPPTPSTEVTATPRDTPATTENTMASTSTPTSGDSVGSAAAESSSSGSSSSADDTATTAEADDPPAAECERDVTRDDQSVVVLTCEMERRDDGSVAVSGTVENAGDAEVYDPAVYVRPYDADGEMIQEGAYERYGRDLPDGPIQPGETADYRVTFEDGDAIADFDVAGFDDAEAGLYESDRNVYWKAFDDERREADDVLSRYTHQDSNGLVVYGQAERLSGLYDVTYSVTVETEEETVEKQIDAGDADENGEVTFAVYFPDVTDDGYDVRVTGHGYTEPRDG